MSLEELIEKYVDEESKDKMESLFQHLSSTGTAAEKEVLAEGYLSLFAQCQYDFACGKFNDPDSIWELKDWIEKVKILNPEFDQTDYCLAHVFDMLSSAVEKESDQVMYCEYSIDYFRNQMELDSDDVDLLINLANAIVRHCELTQLFEPEIHEAIELFVEAMHLEREEAHQHAFFGFNGSGIHHFLHTAYKLLNTPAGVTYHPIFVKAFKNAIYPLAKQDSVVYYYWADTLFNVINWAEHSQTYQGKSFPGLEEKIWKEILEIVPSITDLESDQEFFLTSVGHLFERVASVESLIEYHEIALHYYERAMEINDKTWSNPTYAAGCLQEMALLAMKNGDHKQGREWFDRGLEIYERAQEKIRDFQLSLNHGEYLFEYARFFEAFSNPETLINAQKRFDEAREMGKDFYTGPYYGLAKVALRRKDTQECLNILRKCSDVFSNEYHTHDFKEIKGNPDFTEIQEFLPGIVD